MEIVRSIFLFVIAGIAEIAGGYFIWQYLRESRPWWVGLIGAILVILYGIIPTFQPAHLDFGKVYAAYGGAFIVLALLWGWIIDGNKPDTPSVLGAGIALIGAAIIIYWPRG